MSYIVFCVFSFDVLLLDGVGMELEAGFFYCFFLEKFSAFFSYFECAYLFIINIVSISIIISWTINYFSVARTADIEVLEL